MKITRLQAKNVHGYITIDVEFFDELTFLTGLNGSGKTSALRLLMALLTPNISDLASIDFAYAKVTIRDGGKESTVSAKKTRPGLTLSISSIKEKLVISNSKLEYFLDANRPNELRSPVDGGWLRHSVFQRIKAVSTPMFLGLDRRFFPPGVTNEEMEKDPRRGILVRRFRDKDIHSRGSPLAALAEVNFLVNSKMQEVRAAQEILDERLRAEFFAKAFEYKPSDWMGKPVLAPSRQEIEVYRKQLTNIEKAAEGLKIPVPEIQAALTHFFERMSSVVQSLEKSAVVVKKHENKSNIKSPPQPFVPDKNYLEWIINKPQADRILEHLKLLDEYIAKRNVLRDPITRFVSLVNSFLSQTRKTVSVESSGRLNVTVLGSKVRRHISALSSGERQLLVMLAHLSLNPSLAVSGVFIVDEPELSLHLDWQEKFVDAIREANSKVQLILATHSPAIILDRADACKSLSGVSNA